MGGLLILLALSVVMALAIGVGILVGTSLIVIIPEGIEAVATTTEPPHSHNTRQVAGPRSPKIQWGRIGTTVGGSYDDIFKLGQREAAESDNIRVATRDAVLFDTAVKRDEAKDELTKTPPTDSKSPTTPEEKEHEEHRLPTFYIGFSLVLGFALMFLIDRLPRHATENFQAAPTTRHISLDNLATSSVTGEEDSEGLLSSLAPTPRQSRSLATTTGLVIHAAADGIAMGASATTADMKLGLIIFFAIMIHKAPAAFGLTSVLLKQGLSKRAARGHLIVFSLAAPFGALATYMIISVLGGNMEGDSGQWWTGMLLLFSAGTFLYVAMHAMQEDHSQGHEHQSSMNGYQDNSNISQRKQAKPQMRDTLATVGGMLLPLLTQFGHHH
ncbi:ZIP zinc transporter-domain-containing protein [Bombardia bombarda]|uniref:ZIP zinc transporter-domain-containing protein n=1 Tax=Bombardia bombarda TaxID=252184 RepID=A0AA40CA72_9PEZI|nr:ZIP zinc transporter-domain-containing protein [Bombardia bombarda]